MWQRSLRVQDLLCCGGWGTAVGNQYSQANITDRPLKQVLDDVQKVLTPEVLGDNISYRFIGQATKYGYACCWQYCMNQ